MIESRISPKWAAVAVVGVGALVWLAPSGAYLLAFLGVVILSHEAGHLYAARLVGMKPVEYFWGFGPEIAAVERHGCRYGVKVIFLGGYVKLLGMTPSSELPDDFDEAGTYRAASHRGRLLTILAGPAVNIAMAGLAFFVAAMLEGEGVADAAVAGVSDVWFVIAGTGQALWIWVSNIGAYVQAALDLSGETAPPVRFMSPVSQAEVSGWAVDSGPATTLRWFGILSCAVGIVNLLPLPPLDGSHAAVAAVEGVMDRLRPGRQARLDVSRLVPLAYATVAVLVFLSATALVMDLRDVI